MTADVCACGHLLQTHRFVCSSPGCGCPIFVSEEPPIQLELTTDNLLAVLAAVPTTDTL